MFNRAYFYSNNNKQTLRLFLRKMAARSILSFAYRKIKETTGSKIRFTSFKSFSSGVDPTGKTENLIKTEFVGALNNVALITFTRPKALNALSYALLSEVLCAMDILERNEDVKVIILTGNEKVFVSGGDIKEMVPLNFARCISTNYTAGWDRIPNSKKPIIAAVNGFALGGGCELAMMCDIIYAGENAKFGQTEIKIGTIPGAGGTQRLARIVGKSKAMEMVLTGNYISAQEAEKVGLVAKVFPPEQLLPETIKIADQIASHSPLAVTLAKEAVNVAYETTLSQGLLFEKRTFHATFSTKDRLEGATAFVEKRAPKWKNE